MKIELELWQAVSLGAMLIGAFFGLLKAMLAQQMRHIQEAFAEQKTRLEGIEKTSRDEAGNWQRVEREILQLKADLPLNYVRREDYVQAIATIMAKLDAITLRFENILLRGAKNHE